MIERRLGGRAIFYYKHKRKISNKFYKKNKLNSVNWKIIMWGTTLLLFLIVCVPTLVVMLPKKSNLDSINESVQETFKPASLPDELTSTFEVSVKRTKSNEIENVPLEKYVYSVVASEMPASFELEALKAQAVAARTYVVQHLIQHDGENVVMTDTTEHQVYKNDDELKEIWGQDYEWKKEKIQEAVTETANKIITHKDSPITPTFFSMSNGFTENAEDYWGNELPYLKSVESKWEEGEPGFVEQKILSTEEVANKLNVPIASNTEVSMGIERTDSQRVRNLKINDTMFTGREVREKLDLRSNDFTIEQKNDHFIFTTKGYGHGVGMSQYGANGMAKEGRSFDEILQYYYQGIQIQNMDDFGSLLVSK